MNEPAGLPRSHLFTIRVWEEPIDAQRSEWRGRVQLVTNGEVRYFRDWATLSPLLLTMLSESETDPTREEEKC